MTSETFAKTPVFRVSYPNIFKPKLNELNGKNEYSLVALFPKGADLSALQKAATAAATKKWGADKTKWPKNIRSPFRDQGERAKDVDGKSVLPAGYEAGAIFLTLKSKEKPGVVDQQVNDIMDESEVYAGCYMKASVNAYAYDEKGNRGISFGLGNLQKVKDGESLGGRTRAQDDFSAVEGEAAAGGDGSASSLFA